DFRALLASETQLDFIDVATPPHAHAEIALLALERGVHVLCEKPLTTSMAEARSLVDAARAHRRVVFPAHNYKHAPVVKFAQQVVQSGRIGTVRAVTLNTFRTTHAKGVPEWKTDWRRDRKLAGGGIAMDHGSHSFYLTFAWLGSLPTHVTAKTLTLERQWDTEDNLNAVLTFPNGFAHTFLTWTAGVRKVVYTLQGENGALVIDDDDWELTIGKSSGNTAVEKGVIESDWWWSPAQGAESGPPPRSAPPRAAMRSTSARAGWSACARRPGNAAARGRERSRRAPSTSARKRASTPFAPAQGHPRSCSTT